MPKTDASVWYRSAAPARGADIVRVDAAGDLDAKVDIFKRNRSKLSFEDCADTDKRGLATVNASDLEPGGDYAIRVGKQLGSVADTFKMQVLIPSPPAQPPGKRLPNNGVKQKVNRLTNPSEAYWLNMRAGVTMRLSLSSRYCNALEVFGPGTKSFNNDPIKRLRCGGYTLFTPTESGRHFLVVNAARDRDTQPYRLQTAIARQNDTTPGVFIRNNAEVAGKLDGRLNSSDLYRFDVTSKSTLRLKVTGGPDMVVTRANGRRIDGGSFVERTVRAGRYFVAVQGSSNYTLRRVSRTITTANIRFNGRKNAVIRPGSSTALAIRVRPNVSGRATMVVERFDPIDGWQFQRRFAVQVSSGIGKVTYRPPSVGRYRAYGTFRGSKTAAADETRVSRLRVQGPLVD